MNNRRELILQKALELYLTRGYAGVSISVLQRELQMGRATMYYYFKDKDSLFRAVIEHYYIAPLRDSISGKSDTVLLSELISEHREKQLCMADMIASITQDQTTTLSNLESLMLFAAVRFQDIGREVGELKRQEFQLWKKAIQNSILTGEIAPSADPTHLTYVFTSMKEASDFSVFVKSEYGNRYTNAMDYLLTRLKTGNA